MKPQMSTTKKFNCNMLASDRIFEELLHRLFQSRIKDDLINTFDAVILNSGVAERGVDIQLKREGNNTGAIQCKMNTSKAIDKPTAVKEIIKFCLYYYKDNHLIHDISKFKYYFVCSDKFAGTTIELLSNFNKLIFAEQNIEVWTNSVIKKYVSFKGLQFSNLKQVLFKTLKNLEIIPISYSEINGFLNKYPRVADEYFDVMKVVDNETIESGIENILNVLDPNIEKKIVKFLPAYYKSCKSYLDSVNFIGHNSSFANPRNISVSKLYVEPKFNQKSTSGKDITDEHVSSYPRNFGENLSMSTSDIFKKSKNYILLGEPGAGKSLTVKSLMLRIIKRQKTGWSKKYLKHIPFRIELRKYSENRIKTNAGIIDYLVLLLKTDYQLHDVTKETISFIVHNKPTLFFFDGLDEIFDISKKKCVRDDIMNFTSVNSKVKCIVTSRFVGFREVSFPDEKFHTFAIENFNQKQISSFVKKFYTLQIKNKSTREKEIINCNRQLEQVEQKLKSNPLILSLMTLLSINKIVIPDSKLQVYRACTNTLVETRDLEEKQLTFNIKVSSKRGTFGHIAFWQYKNVTEKNKISRVLVQNSITRYLLTKKECHDTYIASEWADNFLKYAEKRSIYFDNNFTHKTFLEYYTADFIFATYHCGMLIRERDEIILTYVKSKAWHIVFELLISMIDEQVLSNDILDNLIKPLLKTYNDNTYYFLLTIILSAKYISNEIKEKIIEKSLIHLIQALKLDLKSHDEEREIRPDYKNTLDFSKKFLQVAHSSEHHDMVQKIFSELETSPSKEVRIKLYIIILEINSDIPGRENKIPTSYSISNTNALNTLSVKNINLYVTSQINGRITIDVVAQQIKHFGLASIFKKVEQITTINSYRTATLTIYFLHNPFESEKELLEEIKILEENGFNISKVPDSYKPLLLTFFPRKNSAFEKMVKLYIKTSNEKISILLETILSKIDKRYFPNIENEEITSHPKYDILFNTKIKK